MRLVIIHILFLLAGFPIAGYTQDIHHSQFFNTSPYINPALTGQSTPDLNIGANYRQQGKTASVPYETYTLFAGLSTAPKSIRRSEIGYGLRFYNDDAGQGILKTSSAHLSASFTKGFNRHNTFRGTLGFAVGFINKSVDFAKLTFDDQWDGRQFNPEIPTMEPYKSTSVFALDFNFGGLIAMQFSEEVKASVGTSLSHINRPKVSFYDMDARVERKLIFHTRLSIRLTERLAMMPAAFFSNQAEASETIIGTNLVFGEIDDFQLIGGIWHRLERDIIPIAGLKYRDFTMTVSYDVNVSEFHEVSNYQGGPEFSLIKGFYFGERKEFCYPFE
ncbi:MAG: PorP/SprF family type IX secretion system membrane protein [Bacteroidales bacterium]|nr:PorP/SprF family type IX secretion system membrane protein [Bacteroidales bacterium]